MPFAYARVQSGPSLLFRTRFLDLVNQKHFAVLHAHARVHCKHMRGDVCALAVRAPEQSSRTKQTLDRGELLKAANSYQG